MDKKQAAVRSQFLIKSFWHCFMKRLLLCHSTSIVTVSAVVDKRFVNKIGDKTAILRKYDMLTKILFCRHNNVLFWKRKDTLKKQNIDKISLQKRLDCLRKLGCQASAAAYLTLSQPLFTVYPASPDDPSRNLEFGFWSEHHFVIYFLTIVLSTLDSCRRRDEIWPDMSTKKNILDDSTSNCFFFFFSKAYFIQMKWKTSNCYVPHLNCFIHWLI